MIHRKRTDCSKIIRLHLVRYACFFALLVINIHTVFGQSEISPTKNDPNYYIRKQNAARVASSRVHNQNNTQPSVQNRQDSSFSCFIPRDSTYTVLGRTDDGSFGPFALPFSYNLYGTAYTQFYINNNGNITFTGAYTSFTATGFPANIPPMVAGFWADVDTENPLSGRVYYKIFPHRVIITWDGVGYFSYKADKLNTFQIILSDGLDSVVGIGNNTAFYYKDMQWTTGDYNGGAGGFGGTPATVGINKGNGINYIQIGRFNLNSSIYDGPGNNDDGINYLDYECFKFNVTNSSNNIPPSVSGLPTLNPITVNVGDTVKLTPQFIGPEVGQTVTTVVDTRGACRVTHIDTNGTISKVNLTFVADTCNVGTNVITFTATDNGSPIQSTVINYTVIVNKLNQSISFPALSDVIFGIVPFALPATASSGLPINYTVSGPASVASNILTITGVGTVTLTASQPGNTAFNPANSITRSFCVKPAMPSPVTGDTVVCANTQKAYSVTNVTGATFSWVLSGGGSITYNGNNASVQWTTPGTYTISVKYTGNCGSSDSTRTLSVLVDNPLTGAFSNLLPANGSTNMMLPVTFSWSAISNALAYDLYIWPDGTSRPPVPIVANISQPSYTINDSTILHYNTPYRWQVIAKRNCYTLQSATQTFTLRYSPDIIVDSIGIPAVGFAGRIVSVSWKVKNIGRRLTTTNTWTDRIYVSASPVFLAGSTLAQYEFAHTGHLLPDSSYNQVQDILLPQNINGQYYIYVFTDAVQQLNEYNIGGEDNNIKRSIPFTINLRMPADLIVSQLTIPAKASVGQKANFQWTAKNQGDTSLNTSLWYDKLYMSAFPVFSFSNAILIGTYAHTGGLTGNGEYSSSVLATLPIVPQGNYYIYAVTDAENTAVEYDDSNNTRRSTGTVQIGIPDLMASNVSTPGSVGLGQTLKVQWTIKNTGTGATENATWTDRIFLSPNPVYTPNNAVWFDVRFAPITLDAGASVNREINLNVPDIVSGRYYAYVYTDFTNTVYEDTSEYNNIARSAYYSDITTGFPVRDIGVSEVITPLSDCGLGANETVKVRIANYGNLFHTGFNISYQLNNGTVITENVGAATLLPNATLIYTFNAKANLSQVTSYTLKSFTSLPGDTLLSNDTIIATIQHFPALSAPGNLLPVDGSTGLSKPVNFSWSAVPNASKYDLYLWKASDTVPATPIAANLTQINYAVYNPLLYGTTYKWKVVAKSTNCQTPSLTQQFTVRYLPDLVVDSILVPATGGVSENPFSVSWKTKNRGLGATGAGYWYETLYISESPTDRSSDVYIANFQNISALNASESYTHPLYTFTIPQGYQGTYYIILKTNSYRNLEELTDTNNIKVIPITITLAPPPDLHVDSLVVAPTTLFSEDTINVSWTVRNIGSGPTTTAYWTDAVYLSTSDTLNTNVATILGIFPRNGAILPGAFYTRTARIKLPANINGTYYVHVLTDAGNAVYEYVHENNNIATWNSLNIILRPSPNLVITSVSPANDTVSSNQNISLQWTTKNEGAAPANPTWVDHLRLTGDTANGYTNYNSLASYYQTNILQSLSAVGAQTMVRIPYNLPEGRYFFYAVSDIYNHVYEASGETDNVSSYSAPVYVVNPDLKPLQLQAPANALSEQQIALSWSVQNNARSSVYNATWSDAVYLSQDTVFSSNDVQLASVSTNSLLLPGNQYSKQQTVTMPVGISGTYYLILITDAGSSIYEKNETNNRLHVPITITISPWPDLKITAIQNPLKDTAGTAFTFSYTVQNAGLARINNKSWSDVFYLSPTRNMNDPSKIYLTASSNNQRSLDTAQSYTNTVSVQLPYTVSGSYYLYGITDNSNTIFEHTGENNNQKLSDTTVQIAQSVFIDLSAVSGKVIADSLTPGQTVVVEWTGQNAGQGPTRATDWEDAIYLSNNTTLDAADRLLKSVTVNRVLQPGATYTIRNTVTIPYDASGTLYFLVNLDRTNQQGDTIRYNNTRVMNIILGGGQVIDSGGGVVIVPPLPSDLVPIHFQAPATGTSGQPINVSYQVKNNRPGSTNSTSWTDRVYLSTDYVLDGGDVSIGSFTHTGRLDSMAQYADSQQVIIPSYISGNYVLLFKTDANDNVFELNAENNNIAFGNVIIQPQQPCDLIVTRITPPASVQVAGQSSTIQYTVKNAGVNPVQGYFRDAVYLSKDTVWDIDDVLFGTTDLATQYLNPQDTLNRQLTRRLVNVAAGDYYVIVRTDILNNLVEANEANNTTVSATPMTVDVKLLTMGTPANDTLVNGEMLYYRIVIPAAQQGETMSLTLKGDSAHHAVNRLYLKYGAAPAANSADFVSAIAFSANQEIIVPVLQVGTYYIMASGNDTATNLQRVALLARIIPFEITKVDAKKGGNTGAVTIKINGAKFDSATTFKLTSASGTIPAANIYFTNSTQVYATFNLLNASLGLYNVVATKPSNDSARLVNGFEIQQGVGSTAGNGGTGPGTGTGFVCQVVNIGFEEHLETGYEYPPSTRPVRLVGITIFYANTGNVDIPVPTRFFTALKNNVPLALTQTEISMTPGVIDSTTNSTPAGIALNFADPDPGAPPNILRPGASGYRKIYTIAYESNIGTLDFVISK